MKDVNLRGAQIRPLSVDVKKTSNKTLADLKGQLQTGSILSAVVSELSEEGDAIFTTTHGQLRAPYVEGFHKGDKVSLKLIFDEDHLSATITKINDRPNDSGEVIDLELYKAGSSVSKPESSAGDANKPEQVPTKISVRDLSPLKNAIQGELKYLNLTNINKHSVIYQLLQTAKANSKLEIKIITALSPSNLSTYQIDGEVISDPSQQRQLIKTAFGMISVEGEILPVGKKVVIELVSIDSVKINNSNIKAIVSDLLFKLNNSAIKDAIATISNFFRENIDESVLSAQKDLVTDQAMESTTHQSQPLVKEEKQLASLTRSFTTSYEKKETHIVDGKIKNRELATQKNEEKDFRSSLKALATTDGKNGMRELVNSYDKIKELFILKNSEENYSTKWQSFFLPIFTEEDQKRQKIYVQIQKNQQMRFVIDVKLKEFVRIQIEGIITIDLNTRTPEKFDLIVRYKDILGKKLHKQISEIFFINQNITGIRGGVNFELIQEFPDQHLDDSVLI